MKNPLKWYMKRLRESVEPKSATHDISMNVQIPKGKIQGRSLVPCTIYTLSHSIDLNPSLIKRKDRSVVKELPANKKIDYDPKKYDVVLTEEEKKQGYVLKELERCKHCGGKVVIAEVAETRYRSCPDIRVRVSDKAKENLVIPVKFGIRRPEIRARLIFTIFINVVMLFIILNLLFNVDLLGGFGKAVNLGITHIIPSNMIGKIISYSLASLGLLIFLHFMVTINYGTYRMYSWYLKVKPSLRKSRKK
jgi:hypothetical protein